MQPMYTFPFLLHTFLGLRDMNMKKKLYLCIKITSLGRKKDYDNMEMGSRTCPVFSI